MPPRARLRGLLGETLPGTHPATSFGRRRATLRGAAEKHNPLRRVTGAGHDRRLARRALVADPVTRDQHVTGHVALVDVDARAQRARRSPGGAASSRTRRATTFPSLARTSATPWSSVDRLDGTRVVDLERAYAPAAPPVIEPCARWSLETGAVVADNASPALTRTTSAPHRSECDQPEMSYIVGTSSLMSQPRSSIVFGAVGRSPSPVIRSHPGCIARAVQAPESRRTAAPSAHPRSWSPAPGATG